MVNYCCVEGCGRNSRQYPTFNFFSLPKDKERQSQWLEAAGRSDLQGKENLRLESHRVCSRHFPLSSIKNRNLIPDAIPTLCLPGTEQEDDRIDREEHQDIVCNNCETLIQGFRYKCVTCKDYDLCQKCEMYENHPEHYMLRLPRPLKHALADELVENWRKFFQAEHIIPSDEIEVDMDNKNLLDLSSDDDEPITKYVTKSPEYDSGVELSGSVKYLIRQEVIRSLSNKPKEVEKKKPRGVSKKRSRDDSDRTSKKAKGGDLMQEVVFADVNELKHEVPAEMGSDSNQILQPVMHLKLSDDITEIMNESI